MDVPARETKLQKSKEKSLEENEEAMAGSPLDVRSGTDEIGKRNVRKMLRNEEQIEGI